MFGPENVNALDGSGTDRMKSLEDLSEWRVPVVASRFICSRAEDPLLETAASAASLEEKPSFWYRESRDLLSLWFRDVPWRFLLKQRSHGLYRHVL